MPGLFDEKKSYSRPKLKETLGRSPAAIPGTGGKRFSQTQREGLVKEFGSKYGSEISKQDYRGAISDLKREKGKAETHLERRRISEKINFLKKTGGV